MEHPDQILAFNTYGKNPSVCVATLLGENQFSPIEGYRYRCHLDRRNWMADTDMGQICPVFGVHAGSIWAFHHQTIDVSSVPTIAFQATRWFQPIPLN